MRWHPPLLKGRVEEYGRGEEENLADVLMLLGVLVRDGEERVKRAVDVGEVDVRVFWGGWWAEGGPVV